MPLVRIDHPAGRDASDRTALSNGVYDALRETFGVPEDDRFQVFGEHPNTAIVHPASYLGIACSEEFVAIADRLAAKPGLRREDVLINLVEVKKENWSFGHGLAQDAT